MDLISTKQCLINKHFEHNIELLLITAALNVKMLYFDINIYVSVTF